MWDVICVTCAMSGVTRAESGVTRAESGVTCDTCVTSSVACVE